MAFDPLTPAPRLPEDLTVVVGTSPSGPGPLRAMLTQSPDGTVNHVSLMETLTPTYWGSPAELARVWHQPAEDIHSTLAAAQDAAQTLLALIGVPSPRP